MNLHPAQLPQRKALCGPLTSARIARLCVVYGALFIVGLALAQRANEGAWQVFGLGLMLPGAGFLAHADCGSVLGLLHFGLVALSLASFAAALILWFATGNVLAPPAIWLLSALGAAWMKHGGANADSIRQVCLVVASGAAALVLHALIQRWRGARQRKTANQYLTDETAAIARLFQSVQPKAPSELSLPDLKRLRFVLDRALQPLAEFEGFEWIDQFQTAAVRYQLNFAGYALAMARSTFLPAFSGYLDEAQQNLIHKQTSHRVWRYWALENLWGNLRRDPDPTARENIMYTGFVATQIALYQAASGRRDYDHAGSLPLQHPAGARYRLDFPALIAALRRETLQAPFTLIACEPNWVYPLCNSIGAAAVRARDAQMGEQTWPAQSASFRAQLENEFISLGGLFVPCRSTYTGLALPTIGGAMPQAMPCFFLNASLPDIALRQWLLLRRSLLDTRGALRLRQFWPIDTGNYGYSRAAALAGTALAAVEMGDVEIASRCFAALEHECPCVDELDRGGACYRPRASVWAHAVELMARCGVKDGFRSLVEQPRSTQRNPHISRATYPDVLIARAVYQDGLLAATLYPGGAPGRYLIGLSGLLPGQLYASEGCIENQIRADSQGEANLTIPLDGRSEIRIFQKN